MQVGRDAAYGSRLAAGPKSRGIDFPAVAGWFSQVGQCFHLYKP